MTGATSLRCSECGREVKSERRLYRTRRHWRAALLGVALLLIGLGTYYGGEVHRDGCVRAMPTALHIALIPHQTTNASLTELQTRLESGLLQRWETWLLVHRSLQLMESTDDSATLIALIRLVQRIENLGRRGSDTRPWNSWWCATDLVGDAAVEALVKLFRHPDQQVRVEAIRGVGQFTHRASRAFPALVSLLSDSDDAVVKMAQSSLRMLDHRLGAPESTLRFPDVFIMSPRRSLTEVERQFFAALADAAADRDAAVAVLREGVTSDEAYVRALSVYGLASLAPHDALTRDVIIQRCDDNDRMVCATAVGATCILPFDQSVQDILRRSILEGDEYSNAKWKAIRALRLRKHEARHFIPAIRELMETRVQAPWETTRCYQAIGGDSEEAIDYLLKGLESARSERDPFNGASSVLGALAELRVESARAVAAVEPFLSDDDPDTRSAAAVAYVRLGGQDLDLATKAIFDAVYADKRNGGMAFSRWFQFAKHGRISIPVLMEMLNSEKMAHRANAARFLGESWHAGIPALSKLLEMRNDPDPQVRQWVEEAIGKIAWARDHPDWRPPR